MQKPVSASDLFDEEFYLSAYPEISESGLSAFDYYMAIGWVQGHDPSPAFSTLAYLKANPDVAQANINPLQHYVENGIAEGRSLEGAPAVPQGPAEKGPDQERTAYGTLFDEAYYLNTYPEAASSGMAPLDHYLRIGWLNGFDPSPDFSTDAYLDTYPDVAHAGLNPLKHFIQNGRAEGRKIRNVFEAPDVTAPAEPAAPTYQPEDYAGLFDEAFYRGMYPESIDGGVDPLTHYMDTGWQLGLDPSPNFSTEGYFEDHPDIGAARINPLEHYQRFGRDEKRAVRPSRLASGAAEALEHYRRVQLLELSRPFFDEAFYVEAHPEAGEGDISPLEFFLETGWREGHDPSPDFSTRSYLKDYPEVVLTGISPLADYVLSGKHMGRRFRVHSLAEQYGDLGYNEADLQALAKAFDADFYRREYPDTTGSDPFRHYLATGFRANDPNDDFSTSYYYEANPDIAASSLNPYLHYLKHGRREGRRAAGRATRKHIYEQVRLLTGGDTAAKPKKRKPGTAKSIDAGQILAACHMFDCRFVAGQLGIDGDAAAVIEAYLRLPVADRPNANPLFDKLFYRNTYAKDLKPDEDPFLHFIQFGSRSFYYPGRDALRRDAHIIATMGDFDLSYYRAALSGADESEASLDHYLLYGQAKELNPNRNFDTSLYGLLYGDELVGGVSPYVHYVLNARRNYIFANAIDLAVALDAVKLTGIFNEKTYRRRLNLPEAVDPALHYLVWGVRDGAVISNEFDTDYYISQYPDMLDASFNPLVHYVRHGREEGRSGSGDGIKTLMGACDFKKDRETILVVSHEASLTGAPIVALNVARELAKTRNVICWLGKGGALLSEFLDASVACVVGFGGRRSAIAKLDEIIDEYGLQFAYVNSIVSHPLIEPLLTRMIPTTLMIHEFANYVYPKGIVTRSVMLADKVVFPARIVQSSAIEEGRDLKIASYPETLITPQGHNGLVGSAPEKQEVDNLLDLLRVTDRASTNIMFGAGSVGIRKGIDLFIQAADHLNRSGKGDWRFIWVGGGYAPKTDMGYSVYLKDQVSLSGLTDKFFFIPEQRSLDVFWEVADVFFMSSRLDPYPNVALDALNKHVPLVCFEGATGVADLADEFSFAVYRAPYLDISAAAQQICLAVDNKAEISVRFTEQSERMLTHFSFGHYVEQLQQHEAEARASKAKVGRIREALRLRPSHELREVVSQLARFLFSNVSLNETREVELIARSLAVDAFSDIFTVESGQPVRVRRTSYDSYPFAPVSLYQEVETSGSVTLIAWLGDEVELEAIVDPLRLFEGYTVILGGAQISRIKKPALLEKANITFVDAPDIIRFLKIVAGSVATDFVFNLSEYLGARATFTDCVHSARLLFPLGSTFDETAAFLSASDSDVAVFIPRRLYRASSSSPICHHTRFSIMVKTSVLRTFAAEAYAMIDAASDFSGSLDEAFAKFCVENRYGLYRHPRF